MISRLTGFCYEMWIPKRWLNLLYHNNQPLDMWVSGLSMDIHWLFFFQKMENNKNGLKSKRLYVFKYNFSFFKKRI